MSDGKTLDDGRPDRRTKMVGHTQKFLITVPKNTLAEIRVAAKTSVTRGSTDDHRFIDFRLWMYRVGMLHKEPTATKKGVQIHRHHMGRIMLAILSELEPGELTTERVEEMRAQLNRINGS